MSVSKMAAFALLVSSLAHAIALNATAASGASDPSAAQAEFSDHVRSAMSDEGRPPADAARDANRLPVETLAFAGLQGDMDVLELVPGGGWYMRLP